LGFQVGQTSFPGVCTPEALRTQRALGKMPVEEIGLLASLTCGD
jgi:hypothetical protein